jgi:tetratricopeptide (TPR) repeat protein
LGETPRVPSGPAAPGQRISHYEIVAEVGRGGMGVIYRARDLTLGRNVALKCPWPPDPNPRQRSRFLREAKAASRLSHPHIVPLIEVIEDGGTPWLAMELVEGATLRSLLGGDHPLPVLEALRHAEGLAGALQAAHDRNILHRDVNPNNIMITADGRAVLTDFGLAHFVRLSETSSTHTRDSEAAGEGRVVGTPHYMSPEQALGKPLDARSDIFALGAVLYEMCTGRQAFPGTGGDVVDAILHREPTSVSRLNYEVPAELERITRKALAKDPGARYQDARDLLVDLRALRRQLDHESYAGQHVTSPVPPPSRRWWVLGAVALAAAAAAVFVLRGKPETVPVATSTRMRVAVLPLLDVTGGAEKGLGELVQALYVRELTGVQDLGVLDPMSLNGMLDAKLGTRQPRRGPDLYKALGVDELTYVVDGTLTAAKGVVRIQTNVVDPPSGEVRLSLDALVARDEQLPDAVAGLSRQVLAFLQLKGLAANQDKDLRPWLAQRVRNVEAVREFVQASEYAMRRQPGAAPHLRRALELDPTFVSPRVWLVSAYVTAGDFEKAREHYRQLQRLQAGASPFDQAMIAWAGAAIAHDHAAEVGHLEVALTYSPGNNILLASLAEVRFRTGAFDRALEAVGPPIAARWPYPGLAAFQGACLIALGRHDEASQKLKESLETAPPDRDIYAMLAVLARRAGDADAAARYRKQYMSGLRDDRTPRAVLSDDMATLYLLAGLYHPGAEALVEALAADRGRLEPTGYWSEIVYGTWKADEIARAAREAMARDPQWTAGHLVTARIAEAQGRRDEAVREYETFLEANASSPAAAGVRWRAQALRTGPVPAAGR